MVSFDYSHKIIWKVGFTDGGIHLFRGDGDFGKLGRGGSEGCFIPQPIERLNDVGVIQIECGAQFSLALTKAGEIWTWGKVSLWNLIRKMSY